jgi:isohexenylglutaconyl-CoA hydratase
MSEVLVTRQGGVVTATLNRPERRNAMNAALVAQLDALLAELAMDTTARVLVLTGAGGHFCAGLDLTEVGDATGDAETRLAAQLARNRRTGERFAAIAALPQVVIARIEGAAFAGGLGFVCGADIAIAAHNARFAAPEVRRGLVPAQILPWMDRRMGRAATTRMVLEGRTVTAAEALAVGLVHEVAADLDAAVAACIAHVLQGAPGALAETKALLAALGPVSPDAYAEAGAMAFSRCATSAESKEGIAAFREKRPAAWTLTK